MVIPVGIKAAAGKEITFSAEAMNIPDGINVYLEDKNITNLAMYKRAEAGIGYLPQEPSVFRKLSVEDNLKAVEITGNRVKKILKEAHNLTAPK